MKWSRLLLVVATGVIASYMVSKKSNDTFVKPEKVIHMMKNRYKESMSIVGSWIHVEPKIEEINGVAYHTYHGGLTGVINGEPTFLEFKVDADTGSLLHISH